MGGGDTNKTAKDKEVKTPPTTAIQEQSSANATGNVNPDWSGFQAYSPIPPHGFLASSPQAHPYMWGVQHIIPSYGTPAHPYVAMYPPGSMYAHPSIPPGSFPFSPFAMPSPNGIPEASGNALGTVEADSGPSDVKEKLPIKRSKGSLGSLNAITGKNTEHGKSRGGSANGTYSKSGESGSEGTSEGSDANSQNDSQNKSGGQDSLEGYALQNGGSVNGSHNGQSMPTSIMNPSVSIMPISTPGAPALPGPTTNLNIGMDYWGAPASTAISAMHGKVSSTPVTGGIVTTGSRDGINSQAWLQDERELKKQKRKQSNRESARRSRLRKQAECDELGQRAGALKKENDNLRAELNRIKSEYEELLTKNASLKERLGEGQEDFRVGRSDQSPSNDTQQTR